MYLGAGKKGIWGPQPPFWFMCSRYPELGFGWRGHFQFYTQFGRDKRDAAASADR